MSQRDTRIASCSASQSEPFPHPHEMLDRYNLIWTSPGSNDRSAVPLGNGRIGLNAWTEADGDLRFYISHTDSWTELDRLVKLGEIRLSFAPNPFVSGVPYQQELKLREGCLEIVAGNPGQEMRLKVFVASDHPAIHVLGESRIPLVVTASYHTWRTTKREFRPEEMGICDVLGGRPPIQPWESGDVVVGDDSDGVLFYHRNAWSCVPFLTQLQGLGDYLEAVPDTLRNRTFGGRMTLNGARISGPGRLTTSEPVTVFDLKITAHTAQTETQEKWLEEVRALDQAASGGTAAARRTAAWWNAYWERSWIFVEGDPSLAEMDIEMPDSAEPVFPAEPTPSIVTRGYILHKWMTACAGKGNFPIKWNGSIFTVMPFADKVFPVLEQTPDYRRWGEVYLYQNTRLPYTSMLARGDLDLIQTIFRYYRMFWDLNRARARACYGCDGQTSFDITTSFGLVCGPLYGYDRTGMEPGETDNKYGGNVRLSPGLELLFLMLDYWEYAGDAEFLHSEILPYAADLFRFIACLYPQGENGKIVLYPINSVETYWETTDSMPVVAGMRAVLERLLALPDSALSSTERVFFADMLALTPELPTEVVDGVTVPAPARIYKPERQNVEHPQFYAVFPFRLLAIGKPGRDMAVTALRREITGEYYRPFPLGSPPSTPGFSGWQQTGMHAALLGLTEEARTVLIGNSRQFHRIYRFPAMWGPIYDWVPDEDHGANLLNTLQLMAFQVDGDVIHILPAWPREWNVMFKFHAPRNTQIECVYRNGRIEKLTVTPPERLRDVRIPDEFANG